MRFSTRIMLAALLGFMGYSIEVDGHAKLVSPMPMNPNPSKRGVCGVSGAAAVPTNYVVSQVNAQAPLVVQWEIVIADGRGPLTAKLDTTAKNNPSLSDFTVTLPTSAGTRNNPQRVSNIPYKVSFEIPAGTVCTGPNGLCTLRIASSSNWVACATVKLMNTRTTETAPPPILVTDAPTVDVQVPTIPPPPPTIIYDPMPVPTTDAPILPIPVGSGGSGGPLGQRQVVSTQSKSGLQYIISAPTPQVTGRPQGILMFLHGSTASNYANGIRMFAGVATKYDFIQLSVLAPNGRGWNEGGQQAQIRAADMLNNLIQQDVLPSYNIDKNKIFLTGQSSGGGFLSQYFVPLHAKDIPGGGAFFQCGAAPPTAAAQFQPTSATIANFKLHFEITTGDPIWPASYASAIQAYTRTGMKFTMTNTKPGGHCAFDQQQVVLDNITPMLPAPLKLTIADASFVTQSANENDPFQVFSAEPTINTRCVVATGLTTCSKVNGQNVQILTTSDLSAVDMAALDAINFGLNSPDIMNRLPVSQACTSAYRDMICATHFIPCGTTIPTVCQETCQLSNQVCSFNQTMVEGDKSHASMYDCTQQMYQQVYADSNGICANAPAPLPGGDVNGENTNTASSYIPSIMIITITASAIHIISMIFN